MFLTVSHPGICLWSPCFLDFGLLYTQKPKQFKKKNQAVCSLVYNIFSALPWHFTQDYSHSLWRGSRGVAQAASNPSSVISLVSSPVFLLCWPSHSSSKPRSFQTVHVASSLLFSWWASHPWLLHGPWLDPFFSSSINSPLPLLSKSFLVDCVFHHTLNSIKEGTIWLY